MEFKLPKNCRSPPEVVGCLPTVSPTLKLKKSILNLKILEIMGDIDIILIDFKSSFSSTF